MSFYGCDTAPEKVRRLYRALLSCWSIETCTPRFRPNWSPENPTLGQCAITSFLVQDLMGGEVYGVPLEDGGYHCFNTAEGHTFDLTSEQFRGRPVNYASAVLQSREVQFADRGKFERYLLLKEKLLSALPRGWDA